MTHPPLLESLPAAQRLRWEEAYERVENYLKVHHLQGRLLMHQRAGEIIAEAYQHVERHPQCDPVRIAFALTQRRIGNWLAQAGFLEDWKKPRGCARGRLALVLAELPTRWPGTFLSPDPVPDPLAKALVTRTIQPTPPLRFQNMAPEPLELPPLDLGLSTSAFLRPSLSPRLFWLGLFAIGVGTTIGAIGVFTAP